MKTVKCGKKIFSLVFLRFAPLFLRKCLKNTCKVVYFLNPFALKKQENLIFFEKIIPKKRSFACIFRKAAYINAITTKQVDFKKEK